MRLVHWAAEKKEDRVWWEAPEWPPSTTWCGVSRNKEDGRSLLCLFICPQTLCLVWDLKWAVTINSRRSIYVGEPVCYWNDCSFGDDKYLQTTDAAFSQPQPSDCGVYQSSRHVEIPRVGPIRTSLHSELNIEQKWRYLETTQKRSQWTSGGTWTISLKSAF